MRPESKRNYNLKEKAILQVILITLIIANPFILFMLLRTVSATILVFFTILIFMLFLQLKTNIKWIKVYSINILVLFSLLASFEVVFTYCFPDYVIEDLYEVHNKYLLNKPYLNKVLSDKEYSATYITNIQGLRIGSCNNPELKVDSCDWLFIGDSFTQGAQVNFEELYTSLLYEYFPNKVIINAGISGLGIGNEYNLYKDYGVRFKAKKVFLQICNFNDFYNVEPQSASFVDYLMSYSNLARSILFNLRYTQPDELPIGRWTEPFFKSLNDNRDYNIFYKDKSQRQKNDLVSFAKYLKLFNEEVVKNGAELIVVQIPSKEQIYYKDFKEVIDNYQIDVNELDLYYPNTFLRNLCDMYKIKLIDVIERFMKDSERLSFEYDEHLNLLGHKVLAGCIRDSMEAKNEVKINEKLSKKPYGDRYPSLNKQGDSIVYQSLYQDKMELCLSDSSFTNTERLTYGSIDEIHPAIFNNGKRIVYTSGDQNKANTKILILNCEQGTKEIITSDKNEFGSIPNLSPNNDSIVYAGWSTNRDGKYTNTKIMLYSLLNGKKEILVDNKVDSWRPVFAPNGKEIAFISRKYGNYDIFILDLTTRMLKQITNTQCDEWDPNYSPDGKKLVLARKVKDNWDLYEINLENMEERRITNTLGNEWDPIYSKDSNSIIYAGEYGFFGGIYKIKTNR